MPGVRWASVILCVVVSARQVGWVSYVAPSAAQDKDVTIKKVETEKFEEAKDRSVEVPLSVKQGEQVWVALPRLFGGYVWERKAKKRDAKAFKYVKDDQFFQMKDARPGEVTYVAYLFEATEPGEAEYEFRLVRPLDKDKEAAATVTLKLDIEAKGIAR